MTFIEETFALLHVDDVEGVGNTGADVGQPEVEPLLSPRRINVAV